MVTLIVVILLVVHKEALDNAIFKPLFNAIGSLFTFSYKNFGALLTALGFITLFIFVITVWAVYL